VSASQDVETENYRTTVTVGSGFEQTCTLTWARCGQKQAERYRRAFQFSPRRRNNHTIHQAMRTLQRHQCCHARIPRRNVVGLLTTEIQQETSCAQAPGAVPARDADVERYLTAAHRLMIGLVESAQASELAMPSVASTMPFVTECDFLGRPTP